MNKVQRITKARRQAWVLAAAMVGLGGCQPGAQLAKTAEAASNQPPADPMKITASGAVKDQLRVGEVSWKEVGASVTVSARLEVDETRIARVGSPVMGRISSLAVQEGQHVQKGQLLAQLHSTGLSDAQLYFLKSLSQKQVAQRAVERAQLLVKADVIGTAELQRREAELTEAAAELDASRDRLALLGMPAEAIEELRKTRSIHSVSPVVASMDGTVLQRKVAVGQVIQPGDTVCEIADLSRVWLIADVPEANAGHLLVGQQVEAEIAALPGRIIRGQLSFVSATLNQETRTVRARMDLPNPDRRLKPAMLATMVLKDQPERKLVVPVGAVVREGNSENVFVEVEPDTFLLKPVELGGEFRGQREVTSGLNPGEKIVIDGAFHLNNERRRRAVRGGDGD